MYRALTNQNIKKGISGLIYLIAMVVVFSCTAKESKSVLEAEIVKIKFGNNIEQGESFKLDNVLFTHVVNDTTDLMNQEEHNHYDYFENGGPEFIEKGFLPASKLYYRVAQDIHEERVPTGRIAGNFIKVLYAKQSNKVESELIYQVGKAEFLILRGEIFVKRNDDKPINVTSNAKHVTFEAIDPADKKYKSLFDQ